MVVNLKAYYKISDQLVTRKIEEELVIVPLNEGIGDLDAEMFALNTTGAVIFAKLDGTKSLDVIISETAKDFNVSENHIKEDVIELVEKLLAAGFLNIY